MDKIEWWNTHIGDEELTAITNAVKTRQIGMGAITKAFEEDVAQLLGVQYVVATPSGSVALYMALMSLGIGAGDEVIVPDRTFIATAHAVQLTGAKVILVDVNEHNTNIDITKIEEKITANTKVILPVHLNGRAVNIKAINQLAKKNNIFVVEDACQAFLSKNSNGDYLGTISELGCFSLGLAKLITVGYGGFIVCHNEIMYEKLVRFRNHGRVDNAHTSYDSLGFNFKVSDIVMAIGRAQLARNKEKIDHCIKLYNLYEEAIKHLDYIKLIEIDCEREVPLYIEVVCEQRENLINFLNNHGIGINYLPPSLHLSEHLRQEKEDFKHSSYFNNTSFVLPCGPNQSITTIETVINALNTFNV